MPAVPPAPGADRAADFAVWKPFLLRAVVSAVFGLSTVFWGEPSTRGMAAAAGAYLLLTFVGYLWTHRTAGLRTSALSPTMVAGVLLLVAGAVTLVWDERGLAYAGAAALVVSGLAEVQRGIAVRTSVAGRDLITVGAIAAATGGLLPFFERLGAHALLGVTGGGAVLTAVVLGIAALSHRHDSALSGSDTPGPTGKQHDVD